MRRFTLILFRQCVDRFPPTVSPPYQLTYTAPPLRLEEAGGVELFGERQKSRTLTTSLTLSYPKPKVQFLKLHNFEKKSLKKSKNRRASLKQSVNQSFKARRFVVF